MVLQGTGFAPAPVGTGQPFRPTQAPQRAPGPLSPYNPIFNPIISKTDPSTAATNMQAQVGAPNPSPGLLVQLISAPSDAARVQAYRDLCLPCLRWCSYTEHPLHAQHPVDAIAQHGREETQQCCACRQLLTDSTALPHAVSFSKRSLLP